MVRLSLFALVLLSACSSDDPAAPAVYLSSCMPCHGDGLGGAPVTDFISVKRLEAIEERVRKAGGEIVALLKTGSAFYSPATSAIRMAQAYLEDKKEVLPVAAYLEGEYGYSGFSLGVPARIGAGGVEEVVEVKLNEDESKQLEVSASHVKELVGALDNVLAG